MSAFTRDKIQIHRHGAYESEIYYLPIRDEALKTEIITRLLARRTAANPDTPCLDATEEQLRTFISGRLINVIGFVRHVRFPKDEASGSIQIGYDGAYIRICVGITARIETAKHRPLKYYSMYLKELFETSLNCLKLD